jgi:catechol 2,3-dioxygenase-like lactoylglutathione lyase family enzyme
MIHHVNRQIPPSTLDQCVRFYGLLGFKPVPAPEAVAGRAVWLEAAATQVHLMPAADAQPDRGHVAVVVSDYEAVLAELRTAGHEVEPRRKHWGSPRAFVHDPAGHLVELMAFPPPSS